MISAYSTIKEEAFGSPRFMRSERLSIRATLDAPLSDAEDLLIKAYIARGRDDLAGCVKAARSIELSGRFRRVWPTFSVSESFSRSTTMSHCQHDATSGSSSSS